MQRENHSTFVSTSMPIRCKKKKLNTFSLKTGCPVPCGHQDTHLAKTLSSTCSLPERKKYQHKSFR